MNCSKENMLLYGVTDRKWLKDGETMAQAVEQAIKGGTTFIQLREKNISNEEYIEIAKEVKKVTDYYKVPFVIDDNIEVALAVDADGVHIGQSDCELIEARRMLGPDKIIGVTAKTVKQAVEAMNNGADYLGSGAAFGSNTKLDTSTINHNLYKAITASVSIPVVAIGGIDADNIERLKGYGLAGVAVVSSLFASENIEKAARELAKLSKEIVDSRVIRCAVFDMDGTLLDTMGAWATLDERFLGTYGFSTPPEFREIVRPLSLRQVGEYVTTHFDIPLDVEGCMNKINELIEKTYREEAYTKAGVKEVLERLREQGVRMCVATATDRHLVEMGLKHAGIEQYFEGIFTCTEVGKGKDFPDIFVQAMESIDGTKENTIIVEDSIHAIETAKKDGFLVVGIEDEDACLYKEQIMKASDIYLRDYSEWNELVC